MDKYHIYEEIGKGEFSQIYKDGHLPETSVRMFALDVLNGLKYLHMLGYLHCDLRPRNILIDEYGILKISDFKLTKKIPKALLGSAPMSARGTPLFMAPELFSAEGVHSFASEFWSLGCLMFELRMGGQPFSCRWWGSEDSEESIGDGRVPDIVDNIRTKELTHILQQMIVQNQQRQQDRGGGSRGGSSGGRNSTPSKTSAKGRSEVAKEDNMHSYVPSMSRELFDLLAWLLEKVPHYRCDWAKLCAHPFWENSPPAVPQLLPEQPAFDAMTRHFVDAEADDGDSSSLDSSRGTESKQSSGVPAEDKWGSPRNESKRTGVARDIPISAVSAVSNSYSADEFEDFDAKGNLSNGSQHQQRGVSSQRASNDTRTSRDLNRQQQGAESIRGEEDTAFDPVSLLFHPSDSQVKPIVNNKAIEPIEKFIFKGSSSSSLHFSPLSPDALAGMSPERVEAHLGQIYKSLQTLFGSGAGAAVASVTVATERMNVLSYLCTIASNAEVANIVLNSEFVQLLLHIIKLRPSKAQLQTSPRATSTSPRSLAATALALFLRFATFIQPPTTSAQDTHILPVLVSLLSELEANRVDALLRRRALAALGELIFYVSAQGVEDEAQGELRPWVLPPGAVVVLTKSLSDDSDEVVRHYAAKIIENVLAQGAYAIRRRFGSWDIASRLLDLSLHSRNASIQAVSAMALFHLFHMMLHDVPHDTETFADQPISEGIAAGSRFIARVLEKGGLSGFIDCLKDSRPRLQQSYLNIFITVFSASYIEDKKSVDTDSSGHNELDALSSSQPVACDAALKPIRFYFVKSQSQLLPILCRLADQGSSNAIRGKATLAIELICRFQPSLLMALSDCRFQHILSKLLEHDEDERHGMVRGAAAGDTKRDTQSSYVHNCAMSMQRYLRYLLVHSLQGLAGHLRSCTTLSLPRPESHISDAIDLSSANVLDGFDAPQSSGKIYSTPSKSSRSSAYSNTPGRHQQSSSPTLHSTSKQTQGPASRNSPSPLAAVSDMPPTAAAKRARVTVTAALTSRMTDYSTILRSCIQMTSHPALRNLVISSSYLSSLASTLSLLSEIIRQPEWASRLAEEGKDEVVSIAEQAVLLALESVAQVDPTSDEASSSQSSFDDSALDILLTRLIPTAIEFCGDCDGDARVIVIFSLRKLLPTLAIYYQKTPSLHVVFREKVLKGLPVDLLLKDNPPIPQYIVRLLSEVAAVSSACCLDIGAALVSSASSHHSLDSVLRKLLALLEGSGEGVTDGRSSPAEDYMPPDPQVAVLLRFLMGAAGNGAVQKHLVAAGLAEAITACMAIATNKGNTDMLVIVLDLLNGTLKYATETNQASQEMSRTVATLAKSIPLLMGIVTWAGAAGGRRNGGSIDVAMLFVLQGGAIRGLSHFIVLSPDALVSALVTAASSKTFSLSLALSNEDLDWRLVGKLLQVVLSASKSSPGRQRMLELKRALITNSVVQFLSDNCAPSSSSSHQEHANGEDAMNSVKKVCRELMIAFDL